MKKVLILPVERRRRMHGGGNERTRNMEIKISEELNSIINYAREEAMRTGSYGIGPDHLYLGILRHHDNAACGTLEKLGTDTDSMKRFIDSRIFTNEHIPYSEMENITFSRASQNILSLSIMEAAKLRCGEAAPQHLLLALCRSTGSYGTTYLRNIGIDYSRILTYMEKNGLLATDSGQSDDGEEISDGGTEAAGKEQETDIISEFGIDLTKAAAEGKLDPVVGRDEEISRVIEILGRRKKNNPMLIGEPGVGKSAIVEGIALKIAAGTISPALAKKRIITLDIASVVAGTKYRGDFEKRVKTILKAAAEDPDLILFIDEFHTIVGAGGGQGVHPVPDAEPGQGPRCLVAAGTGRPQKIPADHEAHSGAAAPPDAAAGGGHGDPLRGWPRDRRGAAHRRGAGGQSRDPVYRHLSDGTDHRWRVHRVLRPRRAAPGQRAGGQPAGAGIAPAPVQDRHAAAYPPGQRGFQQNGDTGGGRLAPALQL